MAENTQTPAVDNAWLDGSREHYADLPGLRMHYVELGPEDGPPVILLHGFPEFWYSWRFQMKALADAGFRTIAPDQRGYNLTEKNPPYDVATLIQDIANFQDALGLEQSYVASHDWGGVVGWSFAAKHPERVVKLAVMNAPHPSAYLDAMKSGFKQLRKSWYIYFFQIPFLPEWLMSRNDFAAIRKVFRELPRDKMTEEDIDRYVEAHKQPGAIKAMINWYRGLPRAITNMDKIVGDPKVEVPTLVIWGERDVALDKSCNDTLPNYVPNLEIHFIPQATHWVQMDHPEETNTLLLKFFRNPDDSPE